MTSSLAPGGPVPFDAVLFLSFGGPDGPQDVMPFLENVTRGRGIPRERLESVAEHYLHFGGVSPINRLNLDMIDALRADLGRRGIDLPVYFGNRNWNPMVEDTLAEMYRSGHRRILVFPTSAWGGYSGCRQYHEDIARAVAALAEREPASATPAGSVLLRKLPQYWSHPAFVAAGADAVRRAVDQLGPGEVAPRLVFTAHSVPNSADAASGPAADGGGLYSRQVMAASQAVADALGVADFDQVWQSRSGPPQIPWLEPDICDHLEDLHAQGVRRVVVYPVGFISDHLEVVWDLDNEAADVAERLGMDYVRADTVGTDPRFIEMIGDFVETYATGAGDLSAMGCGDNGRTCRERCCVPAARPTRPAVAQPS
ncbi:ferrochelatase [Gordonia sp. zg691]|uniref:Coproporphyrin III ferrochelatase n=1 Tax=Gordonia jinghuaiqii TaxID=2758710 RepID=A0A7D7LRD9_9ACTN|nr:ferrochelatase [Gordonia jinghuaiqii]MBD0861543.1 ferrochelatase [Gordonia jinghuaiqii]MCR5976454.1 ferrochelatase [Gordonia jinghuaiqii]QMS99660.1 ferrochelatase [Gordonia jinghuaiqii]